MQAKNCICNKRGYTLLAMPEHEPHQHVIDVVDECEIILVPDVDWREFRIDSVAAMIERGDPEIIWSMRPPPPSPVQS